MTKIRFAPEVLLHSKRKPPAGLDRRRAGEGKHSTSVLQKEGKDPRERKPYPSHLRHDLKVRHFVSGKIHFDVSGSPYLTQVVQRLNEVEKAICISDLDT